MDNRTTQSEDADLPRTQEFAFVLCMTQKQTLSLNNKACKVLYGTNSKMVVPITVRTVKEEVSNAAMSHGPLMLLVSWIHTRLLQWVGHILRIESSDNETRMIHKTVKYIYTHRLPGDLLMAIPWHCDSQDLVKKTTTKTVKVDRNLCVIYTTIPLCQKSGSPSSQTTFRAQKSRIADQQPLQATTARTRLPHAPGMRNDTMHIYWFGHLSTKITKNSKHYNSLKSYVFSENGIV